MTDLDRIYMHRVEATRLKGLLEAYDRVRADIAVSLNHGSITMAILAAGRGKVVGLIEMEMRAINAVQSACSHAWETIGEAKPVFWRCVRCDLATKDDPVPRAKPATREQLFDDLRAGAEAIARSGQKPP